MNYFCSGQTSEERGEASEAEDDIQQRADVAAGAGVSTERVHLAEQTVRAGRDAGADRDADQDMVPEQAC